MISGRYFAVARRLNFAETEKRSVMCTGGESGE